ncbi:FAD-binding protein [Cereibacter azotoformans]|uniref:Glycolate oxidase FAD binding subunit n=1 Tax=Cereibacter azotoformans TaxID=43057 RepID=A0A2T5KEE7_9RHOB|nr:FAD-binding protein [Cereibacter azotoformans]MBO4169939.1 FAD-binding protein [Cereibacter azotoformans]PTR20799.1 glycolate oxidase FAD binding subunit [Cereibacter azotoformans]UIJ30761.1 FAD-binding protein [Cereibacter azotoformans]
MRPSTEEELAEIVQGAAGPLRIRGGGTRAIGHAAGDLLETVGLAGVRLYEPGALTLVAGAGSRLAEIEALLAGEGQRLPFEVPDMRGLLGRAGASTLGGVVAANASGPRRIQAGACRDSLIGVRFVDGAGQVVKNGGRVMKNVTGYDLVKLLAGSHGTLGVLTEVAFKLLPMPETTVTLALPDLAPDRAVAAMAAALGSPFDPSAAAHWPGRGTFLRVEGFEASVRYRAMRLRALLAPFGVAEEVESPWEAIRDVAPFHGREGDVWRLSLKPSDAPAVAARAGGEALFDWGGGLVWLLCDPGIDLRARIAPFAGHATLIRGSAPVAVFQPEPRPLAAIAAGLRARFDPRGLFNPGLMA